MTGRTETCHTCGAVVDYDSTGKHRNWHTTIDRKIREAEEEARRAKRVAKS